MDNGWPATGPARLLRGSVVGLSATGLALLGHVVGGGALPPGVPLAVLGSAGVLVSVALSGRRWTLAPLLTVLLGSQVAAHVLLDSAHPASAVPAGGAGAHRHALVDHAMSPGASLTMLAGHVAATALTALLLRRGEAWCWRLAALVAAPVRAARLLTGPVPASDMPSLRGPVDRTLAIFSTLLATSQPRRGPPLAVAG